MLSPAVRHIILNGYTNETRALVAAMSVKPPPQRIRLIDRTIRSLVSSGIWARGLLLGVHAAHDAQAGTIDWILPSRSATVVSGMAFTADQGYKGDGSADYLDWGINYGDLGIGQDNVSAFVYSRTDANETSRDLSSASTLNISIAGRLSGNLTTRANDLTNSTTAVADSLGWYGLSRDNASDYVQVKNTTENTISVASTGIGGGNITTGQALGSQFSTRQISITWVGLSLTAAQRSTLRSILVDGYLAGVGAKL